MAVRHYVEYRNRLSLGNRLARLLWNMVQAVLFRSSPTPLFAWRGWLVRLFGGRIHKTARIYPTVRIWAPWNLTMAEGSTMADGVECYSVDHIEIGAEVTVSQRVTLCAGAHDLEDPGRRLVTTPIRLQPACWIFIEAFVGAGVVVGEGAVVAARAVVVKDVAPWTVVGGNPARMIKERHLRALDHGGEVQK